LAAPLKVFLIRVPLYFQVPISQNKETRASPQMVTSDSTRRIRFSQSLRMECFMDSGKGNPCFLLDD